MITLDGWIAVAGLGGFHGLNPGMGWLFAVALGLQQKSRAAVWRALPPIALGHALSIAVFACAALIARAALPGTSLRWVAACALGGFALFRFWKRKHLNWVGMRVGFRDLVLWSFLMASAHGAGLMLAPVLIGQGIVCGTPSFGASIASVSAHILRDSVLTGLTAVGVHTLAHLAMTALIAWLVYEVLGLRVLRQAWFNVDYLWNASLLAMAGIVALS